MISTYVKGSIGEERYDGKLSRTVLKRGLGSDAYSYFNCVEQLTQQAIANSPKLKTLESRIALIDERLELMGERKDYAESRLWTNYLPASSSGGSVIDIINPFAWVKNLAGGGDMQRDRLAIADLEVKAALCCQSRTGKAAGGGEGFTRRKGVEAGARL